MGQIGEINSGKTTTPIVFPTWPMPCLLVPLATLGASTWAGVVFPLVWIPGLFCWLSVIDCFDNYVDWNPRIFQLLISFIHNCIVLWKFIFSCPPPRHYVNQCCIIVKLTIRNKFRWSLNQNAISFINVHLKMSYVTLRHFVQGETSKGMHFRRQQTL